MYKLTIKKSAGKELDSLPEQLFQKIDKALLALKEDPFPFPHAIKFTGENKYRLRIGDYRVVYAVNVEEKIITIYRIRHRKDVYR